MELGGGETRDNYDLIIKLKLLSRTRYILVARYVLSRVGLKYEKGIVYERPLNIEIPEARTKTPIDVNLVSIDEINSGKYQGIKLASGDDSATHRKALERLASGDVCFIARVDDTILGFGWLYFQRSKYEKAFETELTFNDDEALMYDREVFKEFRRSGVSNKLNEEQLRYLQSKNYKKALVFIKFDNIPSIKSFERFGFEPIKYITIKRIFSVKRAEEHIIR